MAFQKDLQIGNSSLIVPDAYISVSRIEFYAKKQILISTSFHASRQDKIDEKDAIAPEKQLPPLKSDDPVFDNFFSMSALVAAGADIVGNAYQYLRTLPEFADAEDVFETLNS